MATDKQIAANRRNAQLSTGPRTPEGKLRSASNALRHGLFSPKHFIHPGEDPTIGEAMVVELLADLAPVTPEEHVRAQMIIALYKRNISLNLLTKTMIEAIADPPNQPPTLKLDYFPQILRESQRMPRLIESARRDYAKLIAERRRDTENFEIEPNPEPEPLPEAPPTPEAARNMEINNIASDRKRFRDFLWEYVNSEPGTFNPNRDIPNLENEPKSQ
jgi:hypothetical protein